jgi:hypothetical protein
MFSVTFYAFIMCVLCGTRNKKVFTLVIFVRCTEEHRGMLLFQVILYYTKGEDVVMAGVSVTACTLIKSE